MSRIIVVTLLLVVLLGSFDGSTVSSAEFRVTRKQLRECRCRVFPDGTEKCRSPLKPTTIREKTHLIKCLCSKGNQHKFPEFQTHCKRWTPGFPIPLV